jgi:hypothetical protein
MNPYRVTVKSKGEIIAQDTAAFPDYRTRWFQRTKPDAVDVQMGEELLQLPLIDTERQGDGKKLLKAFGRIGNYNLKVIFSYGTDPTKPSYAGTFSFKEVRQRRASEAGAA